MWCPAHQTRPDHRQWQSGTVWSQVDKLKAVSVNYSLWAPEIRHIFLLAQQRRLLLYNINLLEYMPVCCMPWLPSILPICFSYSLSLIKGKGGEELRFVLFEIIYKKQKKKTTTTDTFCWIDLQKICELGAGCSGMQSPWPTETIEMAKFHAHRFNFADVTGRLFLWHRLQGPFVYREIYVLWPRMKRTRWRNRVQSSRKVLHDTISTIKLMLIIRGSQRSFQGSLSLFHLQVCSLARIE